MLQYKIKTSEDLNLNNVLNILAFILTWVLNSSVAGPPDREHFWTNGIAELQRRYESILTPADLTYLIAHLILFFEGAFTICQVLPKYRASVMVQEGVQHWFFVSALAQFLWSIDMGIENVWASLVGMFFMVAMFVSLCRILITQAWLTDGNQTPEEYWLLRFPFSVHFGWAFAVMLQSVNGFFVQLGFGMVFQLVLGFISLIAFAGLGFKMLFANGANPNYMIPMVFAWFCVSSSSIIKTFQHSSCSCSCSTILYVLT